MSDRCRLFELPAELRVRIYECLWDAGLQYTLLIDRDFALSCPPAPVKERDTGLPREHALALLHACKPTWREACPVFLDCIVFNVKLTGYGGLPPSFAPQSPDTAARPHRHRHHHHGFLSRIRRLHLHISLQRQDDTAAVTHNLRTLSALLDLEHRPPKLEAIEFDFRNILLGSVDNLVKLLGRLAAQCRRRSADAAKPDLSGRWSADIISPWAWKELREQVGAVNVWYIGGGGAPSWF